MLSVKWVCVVIVPARGVKTTTRGREGAAEEAVEVSSDPKSTYKYSNFHVQFGGSHAGSLPSRPPPTAKPILVLD
jgi:hypothetical protein